MSKGTETIAPRLHGQPQRQLQSGSVVDERYLIVHQLGSGGYGYVYLAHDLRLKRDIAIKVLRPDKVTESAKLRLRREVQVARDVICPQLVRIFDIGNDDELTYVTMELVRGETLRDRIHREPLKIEEALRLMTEILTGLAELHERGIVHRDLKPSNILLDQDGSVKIADFGLARHWDRDETRATDTSSMVGTVEYASPEQALGEEVGPTSDLYSLGIVLFEMLAGKLPHQRRSPLGTILAHIQKRAEDVRVYRPDIPPWLAHVVAKLLQRHPHHRYLSAQDALAALARKKPSLRTRLLFFQRYRWPAAVSAVLTLTGFLYYEGSANITYNDPTKSILATAKSGRALWAKPAINSNLNEFQFGRKRRVAAFLGDAVTPSHDESYTLSILAPRTGKILRQTAMPQSFAFQKKGFAPEFGPSLFKTDLDGDNYDDLLITYLHASNWPSYTLVYQPRFDRSRQIFMASGHHRPVRVADFDGDGHQEILFGGINNRLGLKKALALVDLDPPLNQPFVESASKAVSPGDLYDYSTVNRALLWYTVLPGDACIQEQCIHIDEFRRRILLTNSGNGVPLELGFDGFPDQASGDLVSKEEKKQNRLKAFRSLRQGRRLMYENNPLFASEKLREAHTAAQRAQENDLAEWIRRAQASNLVSQGKLQEAQDLFEELMQETEMPNSVAFEAAEAFHLRGYLTVAKEWYRRSLDNAFWQFIGRSINEILLHYTLLHAELGEHAAAKNELARLAGTNINATARLCLDIIHWHEGRRMHPMEGNYSSRTLDLYQYFQYEIRHRSGANPEKLLTDIHELRKRLSEESRAAFASLVGQLHLETGQTSTALAELRKAYHGNVTDMLQHATARALYPLIAQRLIHAAQAAGAHNEAEALKKEVNDWLSTQESRRYLTLETHSTAISDRTTTTIENGIARALDAEGRLLWQKSLRMDTAGAQVRLSPEQDPLFVGMLNTGKAEDLWSLKTFDLKTGHKLGEVPLQEVPAAIRQLGFSDFFKVDFETLDLDGDAATELLITYNHMNQWPAYSLLYDPRQRRHRTIFMASGHIYATAAADIDNDGVMDLIYVGMNNRMGWFPFLAAVRTPSVESFDSSLKDAPLVAATPGDLAGRIPDNQLTWQALLPQETCTKPHCLRLNRRRREIFVDTNNGSPIVLDFDGFIKRAYQRTPEDRKIARSQAYLVDQQIRDFVKKGDHPAALLLVDEGIDAAKSSEDDQLLEWKLRVRAALLLSANRLEEAERSFRYLLEHTQSPSNVAYEAAEAYHLNGYLEQAVKWYRDGIRADTIQIGGRGVLEHLIGAVTALTELGREDEARDLLNGLEAAHPEYVVECLYYLAWRQGRFLDRPHGSSGYDVFLYWRLENRYITEGATENLLSDVRSALSIVSEESRALVRSLLGELLFEMGNATQGLREVERAVDQLKIDRHHYPVARAHYDWLIRRFCRLAENIDGGPAQRSDELRLDYQQWKSSQESRYSWRSAL